MDKQNRYQRQTILPEIGAEGQEALAKASVLCVGAGGLGCPALLYLAAAGVGRIGIVDFDVVEETNLQRQILFRVADISKNKAEAARARLLELNPEIQIQAYPYELTDKNVLDLFEHYDLIIDGSDNFSTKFLINDAAIKTGKPFIYGSILGFEGQVSVFNHQGGPCYRCLFPAPPQGHIPNCAEAGVIGAVAGLVGASQAMEAIKVIVGHNSLMPLCGYFWSIDTRSMESRRLSLSKNSSCPVCSKDTAKIELCYSSPVCARVDLVTPQQARDCRSAILIDVRESDEWEKGRIEGARHIALSALMQGEVPDLPTDCELILYCQKGRRGEQAATILQEQGCTNIKNMAGGYEAWLCSVGDE